jgi:CRP/FNR family cyclic AMP-dependent transcriptional regulator
MPLYIAESRLLHCGPMHKSSELRQIPVLSFLKDHDLKALSEDITEARYEKGQYIFKEGDPTECFHVLTRGAVKCVKSSQGGKEAVLKVLLPGDLFCCEAAVFDGKPHPGCAQPMGPVTVLKIPKHAYLKLLKTNPAAAIEVIKYLGGRLNEAQETSKTFALERADQRVATLLTRLAERTGRPSSTGIVLALRISRQDIADMTGLAVETTIRTISKLTRQRLIAKSGRSLVIRDLKGLKALAETGAQ